MGEYAVKTIQKTFGSGNIEYLDLYKAPIPYLTSEWDEAAHTPLGLRSEAQNKMLDTVDMKPLIRDDYDSVTPEIGYEFVVKKSFELLGIKEIKFFNIFNTNEITATEDTVQTQLEKEIISWK